MLFNGKIQTQYNNHAIDNVVALQDEGDGFLTFRLAKSCNDPKYKFINRFSIKVNSKMARALANRLIDWADLQETGKVQAA